MRETLCLGKVQLYVLDAFKELGNESRLLDAGNLTINNSELAVLNRLETNAQDAQLLYL